MLKSSDELCSFREITIAVKDLEEASAVICVQDIRGNSEEAFASTVKCLNNMIRLVTQGTETCVYAHSFG